MKTVAKFNKHDKVQTPDGVGEIIFWLGDKYSIQFPGGDTGEYKLSELKPLKRQLSVKLAKELQPGDRFGGRIVKSVLREAGTVTVRTKAKDDLGRAARNGYKVVP